MSATAFKALQTRRQQIFPGEVFAAYAALFEHKRDLQGKDVIFFIDNEAATASLIRGSTAQLDVMSIVQTFHWELLRWNIRAWFEWVDTDSNPSDGLSRAGISDVWSNGQGWELAEAVAPAWDSTSFHEGLARMTLEEARRK
jgi:hypothetical protein